MIFLIITIALAFITGIRLGQYIELKRQKENLKGVVSDVVKAYDEAIDFWLDKQALGRNIN